MKRFNLFLTLAAAAGALTVSAAPVVIPRQVLNYNVEYRWGFIERPVGKGVVTIQSDAQGRFGGTLTGHSVPWGGRQYTVSDSLSAHMTAPGASGVSTEDVLYINGRYTKPFVTTLPDGAEDVSPATAFKNIHGQGTLNASSETMEAVTITADMISVFYFAHQIDFPALSEGATINVPIINPDGTRGGLNITYNGVQAAPAGTGDSQAYAITFDYLYQGAASGYPVTCLVGTTSRIPLSISADIKIGHVEMTYVP